MAKSQHDVGWENCRQALIALIDERYQPMDVVGTELREIAHKLKMPKPVVKDSLTVAKDATVEPQKLNLVAIFIEEYTKHFGVRYLPQINTKGQGPDVGGLAMLKPMFKADERAQFVKVIRAFFKDTDREMAGDGRGYMGKGWLLYLLPSRVNRYTTEIAEKEVDADDAPTFGAQDAKSLRGMMR